MLRHEALKDLSRDHFFLLVHAQRIRKASEADDPSGPLGAALAALIPFWRAEAEPHLAEEEELLLPLLEALEDEGRRVAQQVRSDHAWLRRRAAALEGGGDSTGPGLVEFGRRLDAHVRFEEERAFGLLQERSPAALEAHGARSRAWRTARRGAHAVGPRADCPI